MYIYTNIYMFKFYWIVPWSFCGLPQPHNPIWKQWLLCSKESWLLDIWSNTICPTDIWPNDTDYFCQTINWWGHGLVGQMSFGQMSFGQMSFGQMSFGQMSFCQMSVSQMSVGQMSVGQMSVSQMSVGQMSVGQMSVCQMSVSQMSFSQMFFDKGFDFVLAGIQCFQKFFFKANKLHRLSLAGLCCLV